MTVKGGGAPSTISMNSFTVYKFREKLLNLSISDYQGLDSPGLTCYLNCVLQVLFWTEEFREAVKRCSGNNSTSIDPLLMELFENLEKKRSKTHKIVKILGITDVYEQRDAAEYLEKILCHTSPEASKVFKGELNHKTTCHGCRLSSHSKTFFWILPLAVKDFNHKTYNVQRGLESFFKAQKVSEENQLYCNNCNKKQDADLECELTQSPEALTLLLKRFTFDSKQKRYVKLKCTADVAQTLHFANCRYHLYAVVDHFGDMTGGHYTADIKSFETCSWYCFDDSIVKNVNSKYLKNTLRSHTAYLLMYMKGSARPNSTDDSDPRTAEEGYEEDEQTFEPCPPFSSGSYIDGDDRLFKEELVNQEAAMQHPDINQRGTDFGLLTDGLDAESHVKPNGMSHIKPVMCVSSSARVRKDPAPTAFRSNYREATTGAKNEGKLDKQTYFNHMQGLYGKSCAVSPSKRRSNSLCAAIQPTEIHGSADVDRRSRSLTRNKEKTQRAVSANSRLERSQSSTPRQQSLRREKTPQKHWR
ncbi:ubiquitin carboxyl-terminal hydrolase 47 isoform X2 [Oryzias melastigma]|uniref:Ubiquitin carboxyl-terminal hydrolase 47-like n=1 Tax=Oryzias melastigma TaxID=30732 RepID=A0A3B3C7Y1_ORYME|nr:ubiquitin carboxyl-terminal hydrolase 47 isoform X2 [Oryzias melastigma]